MNCPNCPDRTLALSDRQGIEIDCCPECRGVWLDRGELDKPIERSATQGQARTAQGVAARVRRPDSVDSDRHGTLGPHGQGQRRKNSWLSEIFD